MDSRNAGCELKKTLSGSASASAALTALRLVLGGLCLRDAGCASCLVRMCFVKKVKAIIAVAARHVMPHSS